jgi:hypothetical protein
MQVGIRLAAILTGVLEILLVHAFYVNAQHIVAGEHLATVGTWVRARTLVVDFFVLVQRLAILEVVLRIHEIVLRIRIRGSRPFTSGSGCGSGILLFSSVTFKT